MILSISDMLKRIHGSHNPSLWLFIILFTSAAILYHAQYGTIIERESLAEGSLIQNVFLTNNVENTGCFFFFGFSQGAVNQLF